MPSFQTRHILFLFFGLFLSTAAFGQTSTDLLAKAYDQYRRGDYEDSAALYSRAFKANGGNATVIDRYYAACSWTLSGQPDSAFFNLNYMATLMNYTDDSRITSNTDLYSLRKDQRWEPLLAAIRQNREKAEARLNKPLMAQLESMLTEDQQYRMQTGDIEKKYGRNSPEMRAHGELIDQKDSINRIQVLAILDQYGWLGPDVVGEDGNSMLFLGIQHANLAVQEKYLPMMREAVKNGRAAGSQLALLEDRVALRQGKKQHYGSQIGRDESTGIFYVCPLEDPDNVDQRRAEVGLKPLADYVMRWDIKWDVEQYKKDLPWIEEKEKMGRD